MAKKKIIDSAPEINDIIDKYAEQHKTIDDLRQKLATYHKCALIRPTGFGKTWILTELIKDYNNILYLYPSAVIRNTVVDKYYSDMLDEETDEYIDEDGYVVDKETIESYLELKTIEKCTLMTYSKLIRLTDDEIKEMNYDLILMDEVHRAGAPKTRKAVEKLIAANGRRTDLVGATATPTRSDNIDVIADFFSDKIVYTYSLFDAIESKMIPKPHYCYCSYNVHDDLKNACIDNGEDIKDETVADILNSKAIEIAKIYNMPNIIKDVCSKYAVNTDYMKFIVFFSNKNHIDEKLDEVVSWFKDAYPKYTVDTTRIVSGEKDAKSNIDKIMQLKSDRKKHIDLIACIDMLNMGYHIDNQTGILMYRGTSSSTIFIQQLGRALSAGSSNSAIVFDIVDNLHRKAIFDVEVRTSKKKYAKKETKNLTNYHIGPDGKTLVYTDKNGDIVETQFHLDDFDNILDDHDNTTSFVYQDGKIYNNSDPSTRDINKLTKECLDATGNEATYRELLRKAIAEPATQRCKYALELHFRSWCEYHKVKYPITDKELKELYKLDKKDFYKEFCKKIKKSGLDYPIYDIECLINMGIENDDEIPLAICAKARNISMDAILDMLGIPADCA